MKISINQINPVIGDFEHNLLLAQEGVRQASASGCDLAVFPELTLMGYPPKDLLEKPEFIKRNLEYLEKLSKESLSIGIICGFVDISKSGTGRLINGTAFLHNGKIICTGGKRLLPSYELFDETDYFEPAENSLIFKLNNQRVGVTICEDIWDVGDTGNLSGYRPDPVEELAQKGIDILINISASPYTVNRPPLRTEALRKIAQKYSVPLFYCNQVGGNDELVFDGSSMVIDKKGRAVLCGKEFQSDTLVWDSDTEYKPVADQRPAEEESVINCLATGTRDYVLKCGFKKVIIGLSGGLDSSLVACIAIKALGPQNVTGVSMPSEYTSDLSKRYARQLAENLGISFEEIPIANIFDSYKTALSPMFRELKENETEENLQARIRGTLLMALSNKFNALLLGTGNKSETITGYSTLYGDMCGALAVISDVPKTTCYRLAAYINREQEIIPRGVIERAPSAELRPGQTDQDSLPPYNILDAILEAIIEKKLSFEQIVEQGYDRAMVKDVFRRVVINEFKHRQASPGLKVTSKAFGYGRRYPMARGGELF